MKFPARKPKARLDVLMVTRGLAETRDWAQRLIRAGEVRVNGQVVDMPSKLFGEDIAITITNPPRYVSRGGFKLEAALDHFTIEPAGFVCADVGSSTGGFTDCLLQRGAARVYALDVGANQLHWKLRNDPRVVVMEGVNVRHLEHLPEAVQFATIDVSFISLALILPRVFGWMVPSPPTPLPLGEGRRSSSPVPLPGEEGGTSSPPVPLLKGKKGMRGEGSIVALIKPQFEAGREKVGRGGIVRDPAVHQEVIDRVTAFVTQQGWSVNGLIESPILGMDGNKEFLAWLVRGEIGD
ncbi:MAG: TlyA family RNA methyltransferase [Chloroflexi bacterium]|nr:TlyA family RNA methyltransferase [Chloroflexota bacterium]